MTRAALHALIDRLSDAEVDATAAILDAARAQDYALLQTLVASEEDAAPGDREALAEVDRSDSVDGRDVEQRFSSL